MLINQDQIKICAISSDDTVRISELISLFRAMHGDGYPTPMVYDPAFWRAQIEHRMTSVTAQIDGQIAAHIALRTDKYDPQSIEVSLPLCSPECVELVPEVSRRFSDLIKRQCKRNSWRVVYSYIDSGCALSAELNRTIFSGMESVLLPNYVLAGFDSDQGSSLVSRSMFASQIFPFPDQLGELDLFLPSNHRLIIEKLYEPFGLIRNFIPRPVKSTPNSSYRPLHLTLLPHIETLHLEIIPSLVGDIKPILDKVRGYQSFNQFLFVDLSDPFTPDLSEQLETFGFRFCGVLPRRKGRDSLVLWNSPRLRSELVSTGLVNTARAKLLGEYCRHYDFDLALAAAGLNTQADHSKYSKKREGKRYAEVSGRA